MPLSAVSTMALPAVQTMAKEDEVVMKDWMENFRPDRQLTIRSETTKDKAGSLLPAVYSQSKQTEHSEFNTEPTTADDSSTPIVLSLKPLCSQIIPLASMSCKQSV